MTTVMFAPVEMADRSVYRLSADLYWTEIDAEERRTARKRRGFASMSPIEILTWGYWGWGNHTSDLVKKLGAGLA